MHLFLIHIWAPVPLAAGLLTLREACLVIRFLTGAGSLTSYIASDPPFRPDFVIFRLPAGFVLSLE